METSDMKTPAITMYEFYNSLVTAGFTEDQAFRIILAMATNGS